MGALWQSAIEKFDQRRARVGMLGQGYAGLPLTCCFAEAGFQTFAFDIDAEKINSLKAGRSYIRHISHQRISDLVRAGTLHPTTDFGELATCDCAIICVPTPLGEGQTPDLAAVTQTTESVARHLHQGQLVVLESTTYPGTTDEVLKPMLEAGGLKAGTDFFLAFSPEREDPGNPNFSTREIPKLVGGVTGHCTEVAVAAYRAVVKNAVAVSSARVAESAKLLENIFRCVNIAMINELKLLFERMGIDVWEVIRASATKPFGFTPFYPGPGLGGHCIPIDPFYLSWKAKQYDFTARFVELAGEINTAMPAYVVNRLSEGLNLCGKALNGAKILLLGVAYKRDVDDVRESPALKIINLLEQRRAQVSYHDPYVPHLKSRHLSRVMESRDLTRENLATSDAVVIVTDHTRVDYGMVVNHAKLVVDTRNATVEVRKPGHNVILA